MTMVTNSSVIDSSAKKASRRPSRAGKPKTAKIVRAYFPASPFPLIYVMPTLTRIREEKGLGVHAGIDELGLGLREPAAAQRGQLPEAGLLSIINWSHGTIILVIGLHRCRFFVV